MEQVTPRCMSGSVTRGRSESGRHRSHAFLRRSRLNTPHLRTPKSVLYKRRISQIDQISLLLKELLKKTWKMYKTSPLFNLYTDEQHLKHYSRHLSAFVVAEQRRGEAVSVEECANQAQITAFSHQQDDLHGIKITLKRVAKKGSGPAPTEAPVVLTALLLSAQRTAAILPRGAHRLPLLLVRGPAALTRLLITWLQGSFDCCANLVQLTPLQLSWMVAMWSGEVPGEGGGSRIVQLVYTVPPQVEGLAHITLDINSEHARLLWNSIHKDGGDVFREEEVGCYMKAIEAHFYHYFKIALQGMSLSRVGTPTVYAGVDGKVKLLSGEHVKQVLVYICSQLLEHTFIQPPAVLS